VVAVMGNWFGPQKRGLIMGVWAAHMTTGNIVGAVLGAQMLQYGWVRRTPPPSIRVLHHGPNDTRTRLMIAPGCERVRVLTRAP
jgi:sugar phosphate permease